MCVSRVPIFNGLETDELRKVAALIMKRKYAKGEFMSLEGDPTDHLVIIETGRVKVFRYTPEGKEQILYIFSKGDFFGEKNLLSDRKSTYDVEALEDTDVCMIGRNEFQMLLREYPVIGIKVIQELSGRLENVENAVQSMGTKDVESRISGILLDFAGKYGKQHPRGILVDLPLSREGIANFIGTTRETVSRKLGLLQDEGVIEMIGNKKILVLKKDSLKI